MTAEIAILNRIGVALAADSAVTISSGQGDAKVYDSAEKLFELPGRPVGIMVHGNADFMGIPAEVIVKGYIAWMQTKEPHLSLYAQNFLTYMRHHVEYEESAVRKRVASIVVERLAGLKTMGERDYHVAVGSSDGTFPKSTVFMAKRILELLEEEIDRLREFADARELSDEDLPDELEEIVASAIEAVLGEGLLLKQDRFVEFFKLLFLKEPSVGGEIGIVFAGFGEDDPFPAIYSFECDLAFASKLKLRLTQDAEISSEGHALIVPFAQSEMISRFLDGVDPDYQAFSAAALHGALTLFANQIASRLGLQNDGSNEALFAEFQNLRDAFLEEFDLAAADYRARAFRDRVLQVVQFMPRSDLVDMAESLVNLTSIKRRVSAERETVVGPVDVAIVSKYDGFLWARRKGHVAIRARNGNSRYTTAGVAA